MSRIVNLLTWRYLTHSAYEKAFSPMIAMSFFSICIGTFCLVLVNAIMHGFEKATYQKLQSIHPQIIIKAKDGALNVPLLTKILHEKFPNISHLSPSSVQHAIIRNPRLENFSIVAIKGIYPELEKQIIPLESNIQGTEKNLPLLLEKNQLVIGIGLAKELNLQVKDTIELLIVADEQKKNEQFEVEKFKGIIGGILKTGIEEFDQLLAYVSIDFFNELFPEHGIEQMSLKLKVEEQELLMIKALKEELELPVYSWKDLYPALVSALKLEKYAMFLILTLICIVASMNIFALLFMLITQKKSDFAILRSMGMSPYTVHRIVLNIGLLLTLCGAFTGTIAAVCTSWAINYFKLITLPDVYYVSYLPAIIDPISILGIFILIIFISFIASSYPAYKTKSMNISTILRHEG